MTEFILVLFLCSTVHKTCLPPYQFHERFKDPYNCMVTGYEESGKKLKQIGQPEVNKQKLYIKFDCLERAIIVPKEKPKITT
jgi:hypothetical protein